MKLALIAAVSAVTLMAAPSAFAADVVLNVGGSVAGACGTGNQSGGGPNNPTTNVALGNIADVDGFMNVADRTIDFGNVWCNKSANLTMTVTKLSTSDNPTTDTGSFVQAFDMQVTDAVPSRGVFVYFGSATQASSAGAPLTNTMPQAFETGGATYSKANLHIVKQTVGGNDRPVAGTYAGTITLNVATN